MTYIVNCMKRAQNKIKKGHWRLLTLETDCCQKQCFSSLTIFAVHPFYICSSKINKSISRSIVEAYGIKLRILRTRMLQYSKEISNKTRKKESISHLSPLTFGSRMPFTT